MTCYLVVCDQTLESHKLLVQMQEYQEKEPSSFHILLSASHGERTWVWTESGDQARAQERLDNAVGRFRARGLDVTGEVGDPNPVNAIGDVLLREPNAFAGVMLCTPPPGRGGRIGPDLVQRIERAVPLPLTHLVAASTRPYKGREIPEAGEYEIDRSHSSVDFVARFLTITKIRGRFTDFSGRLRIADVPAESSVDLTIDATSVSTDHPKRDAHLRSADFLDVERYPTLTFASTKVESVTDEVWEVAGDLTLHPGPREGRRARRQEVGRRAHRAGRTHRVGISRAAGTYPPAVVPWAIAVETACLRVPAPPSAGEPQIGERRVEQELDGRPGDLGLADAQVTRPVQPRPQLDRQEEAAPVACGASPGVEAPLNRVDERDQRGRAGMALLP
ncbi:MAG: YceI family protein [Actinobacteria bacterium]|nr:YceI family protein [Actinomycetota bacterium]